MRFVLAACRGKAVSALRCEHGYSTFEVLRNHNEDCIAPIYVHGASHCDGAADSEKVARGLQRWRCLCGASSGGGDLDQSDRVGDATMLAVPCFEQHIGQAAPLEVEAVVCPLGCHTTIAEAMKRYSLSSARMVVDPSHPVPARIPSAEVFSRPVKDATWRAALDPELRLHSSEMIPDEIAAWPQRGSTDDAVGHHRDKS